MDKLHSKEITIEPILWVYKATKKGTHAVKLKITAYRKTKYFPIQLNNKIISLSPAEWQTIVSNSFKKSNQEITTAIEKARLKAHEVTNAIVKTGRPFSFEAFKKEYYSQATTNRFMDIFLKYLDNLKSEGRIGTYRSYKNAYDALNLYLVDKKLKDFTAYDLTTDFLKSFEKFLLLKRGKTTLGIYARTIRTIYNYAASDDYQLKQFYPFGKGPNKYKIQNKGKGAKKGDALTASELKQFILLKPPIVSPEYKAQMLWLFSFYCQGMNFKDICLLRYSNIQGQTIKYIREKTKRTDENEVLEISLTDQMRDIIVRIGNEDKHPQAYVFDLLPPYETDPFVNEPIILQQIKNTNKWLKCTRMSSNSDYIFRYF